MAKLTMGILGPFSGKVGPVVGYIWRGRQIVRAYRKHINYPNTAAQQLERQWFVSMVRFAASARHALLLGLRRRADAWQMTEGNAFVKINKQCFGKNGTIDYQAIRIAEGPAAPVHFTGAAIDPHGILRVAFNPGNSRTSAKPTDRVYLFAYNTASRQAILSAPGKRHLARIDMQLPDGWETQNIQLWGFTVDSLGRASHSAHITLATASTPHPSLPPRHTTADACCAHHDRDRSPTRPSAANASNHSPYPSAATPPSPSTHPV